MMQRTKIRSKILVPSESGVGAVKAFQHAKKESRRIISNKELDELLIAGSLGAGPLRTSHWTGTMTAYVPHGERIGYEIVYWDPEAGYAPNTTLTGKLWRFPVPAGFRGLKNAILVAEHPNYELEVKGDTVTVVVPDGKLKVVENFPAENGLYIPDTEFGIPKGSPVERSSNARYLKRIGTRIGPLRRTDFEGYGDSNRVSVKCYVFADLQPFYSNGVLVEANEAEKIAQDAVAELVHLNKMVKPESIENISKLIKVLTGQ